MITPRKTAKRMGAVNRDRGGRALEHLRGPEEIRRLTLLAAALAVWKEGRRERKNGSMPAADRDERIIGEDAHPASKKSKLYRAELEMQPS